MKFELNDFTIFYNALKSSYLTNLHHGPFEHWALLASNILAIVNYKLQNVMVYKCSSFIKWILGSSQEYFLEISLLSFLPNYQS